MSRYIDADALYKELDGIGGCGADHDTWDAGWDDGITEAIRLLEGAETVNVAPVMKTGLVFDAKTYLRRVGMYDAKIDAKVEEIEHLRQMAMRVTPVLKQDVVAGSFDNDKMGGAVAKIVDLQHEINRCVDDYIAARNEAVALLDQVEDRELYSILYKRYILYAPLEQIACELNYSYRHICRLHGQALQAVHKILKDVLECPTKNGI